MYWSLVAPAVRLQLKLGNKQHKRSKKMKKVIMAVMVLVSGSAMADGFVCTSEEGLSVKVYNNTKPTMGTRLPAVMVLSDENIQDGRKTIATLREVSSLSDGYEVVYSADVQEEIAQRGLRKGELVAGTKLGFIDTLELTVDHNFNDPIPAGEIAPGTLFIETLAGKKIGLDMDCVRYVKN